MQLRQSDLTRRLLIAALLICSVAYAARSCLMAAVLPCVRATVELTHPQFMVFGLDIYRPRSGEVLRLRANLLHPVQIAGRTVYPVAWPTPLRGGFEVSMTLGSVLSPALALLIAAAIWPLRSRVEGMVRASAALMLALLVMVANAAATLHAELLHVAFDSSAAPGLASAAMVASRFLMDGGGFAIAVGLALGAVRVSSVLIAHSRRE